jgi:hypothetical protein
MKTKTLLKVLLGMSCAWLFLLAPSLWNNRVLNRHVEGYRTAWLVVRESVCGADGDRESCLLTGRIDGSETEATLLTRASKGEPYAQGSRIRVLYNPEIPEFGVNGERMQVLDWTGDLAGRSRRFRNYAVGLPVSSLVLTVAVHLLFLFGSRLRTGSGEGTLEADLGGARPAAGVPVLALGLTFVLWQVRGAGVAWAGLILGLLLTALGAWLLRSRHLRLDLAQRHLTLGHHLLGRRLRGGTTVTVPADARVLVSRQDSEGEGDFTVSVGNKPSRVEVVRLPHHADARRLGEALAERLAVPLDDPSAGLPAPR